MLILDHIQQLARYIHNCILFDLISPLRKRSGLLSFTIMLYFILLQADITDPKIALIAGAAMVIGIAFKSIGNIIDAAGDYVVAIIQDATARRRDRKSRNKPNT